MFCTRQSSSEGCWSHTEKAQGSFGVLMYSIVIISQSSTEWILAYKYLSYLCLGNSCYHYYKYEHDYSDTDPPIPSPVLSGYWTIRVFCIAM